MTFKKQLQKMNACSEAIEWAENRTLEQAWNDCERGDWMLWFAEKAGVELRPLTLAKARCAKLVIHLMEDARSINAVEVAERFGLGTATREELDVAAVAAAVAAADAAAYAAVAADADAYAAANAAVATADAAAYAAAYAAYVAATDAADADAYAAANEKETLKKCADICRETLTDYIIK